MTMKLDAAQQIVILFIFNNEGRKVTSYKWDEGGMTIWGLSTKYQPNGDELLEAYRNGVLTVGDVYDTYLRHYVEPTVKGLPVYEDSLALIMNLVDIKVLGDSKSAPYVRQLIMDEVPWNEVDLDKLRANYVRGMESTIAHYKHNHGVDLSAGYKKRIDERLGAQQFIETCLEEHASINMAEVIG